MISSGTSMGGTLYKITSMSKIRSISESNSPSTTFSPFSTSLRKKSIPKWNNLKTNLSLVDLMKQSKLKKDKKLLFDKNYFLNLIKIKLKKKLKNNNFPPIKTLSSLKSLLSINYNTMNTMTNINSNKKNNYLKDKYIKTFSYDNIKQNKINIYKNVFNSNPKNLKKVAVNKFINKKNNACFKTENNFKKIENFKVKNKIGEINYNLNLSKIRFMNFHGYNKKNKNNEKNFMYNLLLQRKFEGFDNKKIRQFFIKKKLNIVNTKMKSAQKNVEETKNRIKDFFNFLNKDIQNNLEEDYKNI